MLIVTLLVLLGTQPFTVDKLALGEFGTAIWRAELDADPTTEDYLAWRVALNGQGYDYKPIVVRSGVVCSGAWVNPWALFALTEVTMGGITVGGPRTLWEANGLQFYHRYQFTVPVCP